METRHLKPLLAALDMGYRHAPHQMLGYFLTNILALWGLPKWQTVPDDAEPVIAKAIETYADIVRAQEPFDDVLGPLYMELASRGGRSALGQFFTPFHISSMMAQMTIGDVPPDDNGSLYRVCDPACGSGVMLLAFAQQALRQWGKAALLRLSLTGCDLDPFCARMLAVQAIANCNLHELQLGEVLVLCGNSLRPWQDMDTVVHASAPSAAEQPPAQAPERLAALAHAAKSHPELVQLELFAA